MPKVEKNQIVFVRYAANQKVEFMTESESGKMRFESVLQSGAKKLTIKQAEKLVKSLNSAAKKSRYAGFIMLSYGHFTAD
jgi:hypothetical protein